MRLLLLALIPCSVQAVVEAPRLRRDLQAAALICKQQPTAALLWQAGIYDTLISARILTHTSQLASLASQQAQREGQAGYAHGSCKDGRAWLMTVSAPYPAVVKGHEVKLAAGLHNYCRGLRAMYAPSGLQRSQTLALKHHRLLLPPQGNGLAAISCLSRQPQKTGPRLLYVFPVGKPAMHAPLLPPHSQHRREQQAVQAWVSAVRKKLGLSALSLQPMPAVGTARFSVIHDRQQLQKVKQVLQQRQQRLLGENRARGHSLNDALTMLWASPFHRDLLLHDRATHLMVEITRQQNQVLVTMLVSAASQNKQ